MIMICIVDNNNVIINIVAADYPQLENEKKYCKWNVIGEAYTDVEPFNFMKDRLYNSLGAEFAKRRDAVRFINLPSGKRYGFDTASEDITNFMAAYTPLAIKGEGSTGYKVWLSEEEKGLVILTYEDLDFAYNFVRTSQLSAYAWLSTSQGKLSAVSESEGTAKLQQVYDECLATPTE